jgi:tellurite methyltransferase
MFGQGIPLRACPGSVAVRYSRHKVNQSISFFESQFQRDIPAGRFALNPFERAAVEYVKGRTLDLGCGLGNLSMEAARRGASVLAVDGSPSAIEHLKALSAAEHLSITPLLADLENYPIREAFDTVVAIGILMFFRRDKAMALLKDIQAGVVPGGVAIVNVLTAGTTFMGMFEPEHYYLFEQGELARHFDGWTLLLERHERFDAPGSTQKEFDTVVARR